MNHPLLVFLVARDVHMFLFNKDILWTPPKTMDAKKKLKKEIREKTGRNRGKNQKTLTRLVEPAILASI